MNLRSREGAPHGMPTDCESGCPAKSVNVRPLPVGELARRDEGALGGGMEGVRVRLERRVAERVREPTRVERDRFELSEQLVHRFGAARVGTDDTHVREDSTYSS